MVQRVPGAQPRRPTAAPPQIPNIEKTDFGGVIISKVSRNLPLGQNKSLKSADD